MTDADVQSGWDLGELARAAGAEVRGGGLLARVEAVGTDTRSLPPQCVFVALRGENFDGHDFVTKAIDTGCVAVVIDHEGAAALPAQDSLGVPVLVVEDTLHALGEFAAYHRRALARVVAAITGSNGKTTTKELLAAALMARGPVHKTQGNLNNLIGLPKTLLGWVGDARAAVVEMGMSIPGEIKRLVEIAAPDLGIITNVAAAHLEGLKSIEGVAAAKGELFAGLPENAVGVVNADDPMVEKICVPALENRSRVSFGWSDSADIRVIAQAPRHDGICVNLSIGGRLVDIEVPLFGPHNAMNVAAAVAGATALGASVRTICDGLTNVSVPGGRSRVLRNCPGGLNLIDDTYNANPASMSAAFETVVDLAGQARRIAVLGDMLELGHQTEELHRAAGRAAALAGIEWVLSVGDLGAAVAEGAREAGARAEAYPGMDELVAALHDGVQSGDWIVVKGSRGMRMERVVASIEGGEG